MYTCIKTWTHDMYNPHFCWSFLIQVLFKFFRLFAFIRAVFVVYLWGLVSLNLNTFQFHSLSPLTPSTTRLTCLSHSIYHTSASRPTRNAITWLPHDHTEPTHRTLRTRLTPENPDQMHITWWHTTHNVFAHTATPSAFPRCTYGNPVRVPSLHIQQPRSRSVVTHMVTPSALLHRTYGNPVRDPSSHIRYPHPRLTTTQIYLTTFNNNMLTVPDAISIAREYKHQSIQKTNNQIQQYKAVLEPIKTEVLKI